MAKVFISYAWTNPDYISKVLLLAERLMSDGVETIIDKWNLMPGQDKNAFMEQMIQDSSLTNVLLLLNHEYKNKSDERKGGVGTEAQIISADLYNKIDQTKFIPVVTETDEEGEAYLPIYLKSRIYVDLSNEEKYEDQYEELLRIIYQRPQFQKPKLGTPPAWLFDDKENISPLNTKERIFINSIRKEERNALIKIRDYLETVKTELEKFRISEIYNGQSEFGKTAYDTFITMTPIRDSMLTVLKNVALGKDSDIFDEYFQFFRDAETFYRPSANSRQNSWTQGQYDNYVLFYYELILSSFSLLLKFNRYDFANVFLSNVLLKDNASNVLYGGIVNNIDTIYEKFENLYVIPDYYKKISEKNYYQPVVEILRTRIFSDLNLSDLIEGDLVLHYYRTFSESYSTYFPKFTLYLNECKLLFFINLIYKDKSKKVLQVFGVDTLDELKIKINNGKFPYDRAFVGEYNRIPKLTVLIQEDLWGTK